MTYLIGAILVLLIIALLLVFRPPRQKPQVDAEQEAVQEAATASDEQLDLDIEYGGASKEGQGEELDLSIDESKIIPAAGDDREPKSDLELFLEGEIDQDRKEEADLRGVDAPRAEPEQESSYDEESAGSDEYDEDIPFIDDEKDGREHSGEVAPALADVPEDYTQLAEDETPEELAERLEYFLGTDDGEPDMELAEADTEEVEEPPSVDEQIEAVDTEAEAETAVPEAEVEPDADIFTAELKEQETRLRRDLESAIQGRDTGRIAPLSTALESLCMKLSALPDSIQEHHHLLGRLDDVMERVQQSLPGFQSETVRNSLEQGDYEVARTLLTEAAARLDSSPQLAAEILFTWGCLAEEKSDFASALDMYSRAEGLDEANPQYLFAAGRLARIMGDADDALTRLEKRVSQGQQQNEESVAMARAEHELARVLFSAEDKEGVEELLSHSMETMERLLGTEHGDLAPVVYDLGLFHDSAGRYEQAEMLYTKAIEITEKVSGQDSPRLGAMLNRLAGLYEEIDMDEKSEVLYRRALEIRKSVLGGNHPDVGTVMGHLANLYRQKGKYDQAEPLYRKSLEIAEVALGKDHPNLAVVLNDMAELYSAMGNEKQAEYYQERAFASFGLPGMGDGFVEMEKDTAPEGDDDSDQKVAGS